MDKDKLIAEYTQLCLRFVAFTGPDPVDEEERNCVIYRMKQIRELLGMEPIKLE